jgi:hypothetical protein
MTDAKGEVLFRVDAWHICGNGDQACTDEVTIGSRQAENLFSI